MSIPIEKIMRGDLLELTNPFGSRRLCWVESRHSDGALVVCDSFGAIRTLGEWIGDGWQFTARYIRCKSEPARCPTCRGNGRIEMLEHCPTCNGSGRVWIAPATKERDDA